MCVFRAQIPLAMSHKPKVRATFYFGVDAVHTPTVIHKAIALLSTLQDQHSSILKGPSD